MNKSYIKRIKTARLLTLIATTLLLLTMLGAAMSDPDSGTDLGGGDRAQLVPDDLVRDYGFDVGLEPGNEPDAQWSSLTGGGLSVEIVEERLR